jgi:hypothetical protein
MNDILISLYIDNELNLDEKITFVETVHADQAFTDETVALLRQEQRLRQVPTMCLAPPLTIQATAPSRWQRLTTWLKPLVGCTVAAVAVALMLLVLRPDTSAPQAEWHRFVVYLPEARQPRIIGTFTDWRPVALEPVGGSGYWTLTLKVPEGEHRYSYLVGDDRQIADPTVAVREQDDFGGENSVIEVRGAI